MSEKKTVISKKVKTNPAFTYSHPPDSLDIETEIVQVITNNSVINNYITNLVNQVITEVKVPLDIVQVQMDGSSAALSNVLAPNYLYIGSGGSLNEGVVLPANPTEATEIYIINDTGGDRLIWGNTSNGSVIYNQGWNSASSSKVLSSDGGIIHKFTYVKFLNNVRWVHQELTMV